MGLRDEMTEVKYGIPWDDFLLINVMACNIADLGQNNFVKLLGAVKGESVLVFIGNLQIRWFQV